MDRLIRSELLNLFADYSTYKDCPKCNGIKTFGNYMDTWVNSEGEYNMGFFTKCSKCGYNKPYSVSWNNIEVEEEKRSIRNDNK